MLFEWDHKKEILNIARHGISFEEAKEVFDDPLHLSILDHRYSYFEERWITMGTTRGRRLLVVAHLYFDEAGEEIIRIISAREATVHEQGQYEDI
ncbi:MAG TPA: BrnT family toxin [bacterium]|nr:BrnT family toxin [bacterium]